MKNVTVKLGALLMLCGTMLAAETPKQQELVLKDAVECTPRNGLPNFLAKCEKGGTLKVAYLGGSITSQTGWRIYSLDFLRRKYPQTKFEEVYAAIGGTGSSFGVYRLEKDVLNAKPDLLFVEFATNDGCGTKDFGMHATIKRSMEGIVRNTWETLPDCDICFVYTVAGEPSQKLLENGKCNAPATLNEGIADQYGIPTIHLGIEAARLAKEGKLVWKSPKAKMTAVSGAELDKASGLQTNPDGKIPFADDGVHPYLDTGHKLYEDAIERSFPKIQEASGSPAPHGKLPEPVVKDYTKAVAFFPVDQSLLQGEWRKLDDPMKDLKTHPSVYVPDDFRKFVPSVWEGKPGATLSFEFTGRNLLLFTCSGPAAGWLEIEVDGKKTKVPTFDGYSRYWRISPRANFFGSLDPEKTHSFKLTVLSDAIDKKALLNEGGKKFYDMSPESFQPTNCYLGGICVEGGRIVGK